MGTGGMAVVMGLEADAVRAVCREAAQDEVVEAVNFNDQTQIVIAGSKNAVERAMAGAKAARLAKRALPLPVSARRSTPSLLASRRPTACAKSSPACKSASRTSR